MKFRLPLVSVLLPLLLAGCGKKEATATAAAAAPTPAAAAPAAAVPASPRVIEITANDTMKFSVTAVEAKVGEQLKFVLTNSGTMAKEVMGHNLVLLKAGSDSAAFSAAATVAKATDYIPDALKDQVLGHTELLGPRKSGEFTVTVTAAGEYPFLCSFPAHFAIGMKGVLTVK
jgi:azurin